MEGDRLSQLAYIQRVQAAFYDLLRYVETYSGSWETQEQQHAFFESFLEGRALRQTKRSKNLWFNGAYHTPLTFRDSLRDAISRHGQRRPRTLHESMAYFFDAKSKTFNESYTCKCKASSEQSGKWTSATSTAPERSDDLKWDDAERLTELTMSPAPEEMKIPIPCSEELFNPCMNGLFGHRGPRRTKPGRFQQPGNGAIKRRRPRREPINRDNTSPQADRSSYPNRLIPVIHKQGMPKKPLSGWHHDSRSKRALGDNMGLDSKRLHTGRLCRPIQPDRRLIESRMARAEAMYHSLRDVLGEGRDDQASFIAEPSWLLQRLYTTALGSNWRIVFARLQQERLAEHADILYTLTGAAIYNLVFGQATHDPRRSSTASSTVEDSSAALRQDRLSNEDSAELSMVFALRLSKALDEHMSHQPPKASRPNGIISQDLEKELSLVFAEALALKQSMLATGADVVYGWHHPGRQYDTDTMSIRVSHAAPPRGSEHACRVALCFLPSIQINEDHHVLYRGQVKVAGENWAAVQSMCSCSAR